MTTKEFFSSATSVSSATSASYFNSERLTIFTAIYILKVKNLIIESTSYNSAKIRSFISSKH